MKIVPVADMKARLSSYLKECARNPIVVTKNGRPVAVLVSVADEEELERLVLSHTPRFRRLLELAEARVKKTGGIKHRDFWAKVRRSDKRKVGALRSK